MAASPTSSDEQFELGSVLDGRYRIEAVLGTGGMGRVYRAEHTKIGKSVAIKVLHADLGRNREASQRFQREAIASGRLDHPNIVGVSDFGVLDDGACYLVMEVLEGESLGDRLARDKRIHWVEAIDILRGVLNGLRHAHERGVVHRDIKPDNVYLAHKDGDPVIKILDFGIAKLYAGTDEDPAQTRAGLTVGTPAYLSPEQAVGGEITPKSDLYSASIVLYEMLAGRAPFEDKDPLAMLGAHVSRQPPPFAEVAVGLDIPQPLEDIIRHGLMKMAAERIPTAGDYLAMLDAFSPPLHAMPRFTTSSGLEIWTAAPATPAASAQMSNLTTPLPATPVPGVAATEPSYATPVPGHATPVPGRATPVPGHATPVPGHATPVPAHATPVAGQATPVAGQATPVPGHATPLPGTPASLEVARLPRATRAVSLADVAEPIPQTWIVRSGVVIGLVILVAIVLAIATHCNGSASSPGPPPKPLLTPASVTKPPAAPVTKPPAASAAKPPAAAAARPPVTPSPPVPAAAVPASAAPSAGPVNPVAPQLQALVHELETGRTCAHRKAAVAKLVELRDPGAIPALKRARNRMAGGLLGFGGDNVNACLKADAERAIKQLGGTLK